MVKVSVVIPVYNVEEYLADCLNSIVNQTLKDIEIICINDGSTDNSLEILNKYAEKDKRITVISQKNGGHAVATNRGISLAKGKYLFLMDSDDVVELNALELTYKAAEEKNVDFVLFKAINYDHPNNRYYETEVYSMGEIYRKVGENIFNYKDIGPLMFQASVTPWSKLYNREFITKNNIHFPEGLIFEDNVFFYEALFCAEKIYFLNEFLFIRRWYDNSSTKAGDLRFLNSIDVINLLFKVFKKHNEYENYKKQLFNMKINIGTMRYSKIKDEYKETYYQRLRKEMLEILEDPTLYRDLITSVNYHNKKIFEKIIIAENSHEFELIENTYKNKMKIDKKEKEIFNKIIQQDRLNFHNTPEEYKPAYFNQIKKDYTEILQDKELYLKVFLNLSYRNRKIFEKIIISDDYEEYKIIKNTYDTKMRSENIKRKYEKMTGTST